MVRKSLMTNLPPRCLLFASKAKRLVKQQSTYTTQQSKINYLVDQNAFTVPLSVTEKPYYAGAGANSYIISSGKSVDPEGVCASWTLRGKFSMSYDRILDADLMYDGCQSLGIVPGSPTSTVHTERTPSPTDCNFSATDFHAQPRPTGPWQAFSTPIIRTCFAATGTRPRTGGGTRAFPL
jgi:hypothetical protein